MSHVFFKERTFVAWCIVYAHLLFIVVLGKQFREGVTAEVKRLEEVVDRQQKDNDLLYKEHQELSKDKEKFNKMSRAYTLFREREPEAFARAFFRASSIVGAFIPKGEPIANLGKSRLQQIEEEIEREKTPKEMNKKFNSKGD